MQTVTTFNMMMIWMCRRHDDFRSAAPIVEIAMQLHVSSASEKSGGLSPSRKSGGPIPLPPQLRRNVRVCNLFPNAQNVFPQPIRVLGTDVFCEKFSHVLSSANF